ncbi:unnamed protein product [Acanthoscelides obtectus]|nr:unnamed protein product [Acanthoscelides obtectus]CAK1625025.1 RNA polymerase I-specific transcription initiation factor RRN3 [Acanthoscelides obtectus]
MTSATSQFPYYNKSTHVHEYYVHNLLWILEYQPKFRQDVLYLILSKLVILDVNAPREEIQKFAEDEDIFSMDDTKSVKSLKSSTTAFTQVNRLVVADTLDICLDKLFNYIIDECHDSSSGEVDWEKLKKLYHEIIPIFDKLILPTYDTHHVQYVMFLMCCLKSTVAEAFLNYLWKKVCNPNVPRVLRQAAVNYIASLLARANFITLALLKSVLTQIAEWIHMYISNQDSLECVNVDLRVHGVFYSICQGLFYIVAFRHKDFAGTKKGISFLGSLNMGKIITSRLNPLRVCQPAVVQNFAAITRQYQLAYCYTVIEHNARNTMPMIYQDEKGSVMMSNNVLDAYYPFDPYVLERSSKKIQPFYRDYHEELLKEEMEVDLNGKEPDVDDFLYNNDMSSPSNSKTMKFSYGTSPGFKFKG